MVEQAKEKTRWTQAELVEEARARFGDDARKWSFRCPSCGDDATAQDFKDAGAEPGRVGQECIGRSLGGCDWTAYGLFHGPWTIVIPASGDKPEHDAYGFPLSPASDS